MDMRKCTEFLDKTVTTSDGQVVGEVCDVVFDTESWKVSDFQIRVDKTSAKEMGIKTPLLRSLLILVSTEQIHSAKDQIVVDIGASDFKEYVESREDS